MQDTMNKFIQYLRNLSDTSLSMATKKVYKAKEEKTINLKNFISFSRNLYYEQDITMLDALADTASILKKEWIEKSEIFVDFDILSKFLLDSPFSEKECIEIIMSFIENNIAVIDNAQLNNNSEKSITFYKMFEKIRSSHILTPKKENRLSKKDIKDRREFEKQNIDKIIEQNEIIKKYYFNAPNDLNEADIDTLIKTLELMKVDIKICDKLRRILFKEYNKKSRIITSYVCTKDLPKEMCQNKMLSKKEYYEKEREINQYFDLKKMKAIRYISTSEKIEVATLLKEINYKNEEIEKILRLIDNGNKIYHEKIHPMIEYMNVIDKIMYYKNELQLDEQQLEDLEYNFTILFVCDDNEYAEWKKELEIILEMLEVMLPKTYKYELEEAEKAATLIKR